MKIKWGKKIVRFIRKPKIRQISFVIVPEASNRVKTIRIPRFVLYLVPSASLLTACLLVGFAFGIYMSNQKTMQANHQLSMQLAESSNQYVLTVSEKEQTIKQLQNNVLQLSQQANEMNTKVEQLEKLEKDLKSLTQADTAPAKNSNPVSIASANAEDSSEYGIGGGGTDSFDSIDLGGNPNGSDSEFNQFVVDTETNFEDLYLQLDRLYSNLSDARQIVLDRQEILRITPSMWPTISKRITSPYGSRRDPFTGRYTFHDGVDIGAKMNDPVYVTADGVVRYTGYDRSRGNNIIVQHESGVLTQYMHLNKILVEDGEKVKKGQTIGKVGTTGRSTGPHLHYQVIKNGKVIDPMPYTRKPDFGKDGSK